MGTYLKFRVPQAVITEADKWLRSQRRLKGLGLWTEKDREIELKKGDRGMPDLMPLGAGDYKVGAAEEKDLEKLVDILEQAREKFQLECYDVSSCVADYMSEQQMRRLFDLDEVKERWAAEKRLDARWDKARKKAETKARTEHRSGVGMMLKTWSDKLARGLFMHTSAKSHPQWVKIHYNLKGEYYLSASGETEEDYQSRLFRDEDDRAFFALPLLVLGPPTVEGGVHDMIDYLSRARSIGMMELPEDVLLGVYHMILEPTVKFGNAVRQIGGTRGPFVRGEYDVVVSSFLRTDKCVDVSHLQELTCGPSSAQRMLKLRRKGAKSKDNDGVAAEVIITYPGLVKLMQEIRTAKPKKKETSKAS